jgi:hypothetical protein
MDAKRRQYLYDQFVLTLQNEGDWYRSACRYLQQYDSLTKFRTLTDDWVHNYVGRWNCDDLNSMEYAYIQMELFKHLKEQGMTPPITAWPAAWVRCVEQIRACTKQERDAKMAKSEQRTKVSMDEILGHLENANETFLDVEEKLNAAIEETKEKNTMNNIPFITKNYVFGQDVSVMTEDQLIASIKKVEAEIANLEAVKTKSKKIEQLIKDAKDGLAKIVEVLDAK